MNIRNATFGDLFGTAFFVGLAFDAALFLAGLIAAFVNPGFFHSSNGSATQVAATSPGQAVGILVLITLILILLNLVVAAGGAGVLMLARSVTPGRKRAAAPGGG